MDPQLIENTLVPHAAFKNAASRIAQCFAYAEASSEPICMALIGESRTGKTRVIDEFFAMNKPYRTELGLYTPVLRIRTPSKPTVKAVVSLMLQAMGDPAFNKGTEVEMTKRLEVLLNACKTRLIVIDEFQHFIDKGTQLVAYQLADWLKNLLDDNRVGLIVVGLPNCMTVIHQNEQLEGRFLAPVELYRFDWNNKQHRSDFAGIVMAFHDSLKPYLDVPFLASPEMALRLYCATAGLIGNLTKVLRQVIWTVIDTSNQRVDLVGFQHAHKLSVIWPIELPNPFEEDFLSICDESLIQKITSSVVAAKASPAANYRKQGHQSLTSRSVFGKGK